MSMTREQATRVARLARLNLADAELDRLASDMDAILGYVDKLDELKVDGIEPTAHAVPMANAFREDLARPSMGTEKALANAPDADSECFLVPKVIE